LSNEREIKGFQKNLDDNIRNAFNVVLKAKKYIILASVIFFVSMAAGVIMHERLAYLIKYLATFAEGLKEENTAGIILGLFQKNLLATLVVIISGIALGIIPICSLSVNGAVMGVVIAAALQRGVGIVTLIALIVPHSIFELPAFFIAGGVAMRIGLMQFRREGREPAGKRVLEGLQVLIFVVVPLLIIAAIIEGVNISLLT